MKSNFFYLFSKVLVCIVLMYFFINAFFYGLSLPNLDDWRYFLPTSMNWDKGFSPFQAMNDTVSAIPLLWDQLLFRIFAYDFRLLRLFSFGWLFLYLIVLFKISSLEENKIFSGFCILATVLVLRVGGYWDYPTYIAYHQAIPVICCVLIIFIVARAEYLQYSLANFQLLSIALLGIFSGLSYISGAVALVAMSSAYIVLSKIQLNPLTRNLRRVGFLLFVVGIFLFIFQYYSVSVVQGSLLESSHAAANVFPNNAKFWFFAYGLLAKGVGVEGSGFVANFITVPILFFVFLFSALRDLHESRSEVITNVKSIQRATVYLPAIAILIIYVAAVSFGRGGFFVSDYDIRGISVAKSRFHFWWVSALFPLLFFSTVKLFNRRIFSELFFVLMLLWIGYQFYFYGSFDYKRQFTRINVNELIGVQCVKQSIEDKAEKFLCKDFYPTDIKPAIEEVLEKRSDFFELKNRNMNSKIEWTKGVPAAVQQSGFIDEVKDLGASLEIVGWMPVDFENKKSKILIRTNMEFNSVYVNYIRRPDVAASLKNSDFVNSGFKIYIPKNLQYSCIYAVQDSIAYYPSPFLKSDCEE